MSRQATRSARSRWLLGLALPAVTVLAGCDSDSGRADKTVDEKLAQAAAANNGTEDGRRAAHPLLDAAVKETGASPSEQLRAKAMLADVELAQADAIAAKVGMTGSTIDGLTRDLARLTAAVSDDTRLVALLNRKDPTAVQAAMKQASTAMTGSADKPDWLTTESGALPSLAASDKSAADLQQQVDTLTGQIKADTDQRSQLTAQSDQVLRQSQQEQHGKSVELFTQSADARRQAGDLGAKIDQEKTQLAQAQADLAVRQAHGASVKGSLAQGATDAGEVDKTWAAVGVQAAAVKAHAQQLAGEGEPAVVPAATPAAGKMPRVPQTIAAKADALAKLLRQQRADRAEADAHFNNAVGFYKDAYDKAGAIRSTLGDAAHSDRPDRLSSAAWDVSKESVSPAQFRYLQATAQSDRAEFYTRAAAEARSVASVAAEVKRALGEAGLKVPDALNDANGDLPNVAKLDRTQAADGFKAAVDNLNNMAGDVPAAVKQAAAVSQMFAEYGWSVLLASDGDQQSTVHLEAAKTARDNAVNAGAPLPMLPTALAIPTAAATTPGTAPPTTPPATPPTTPAAAAPAGRT